jgi:hypothetical protein
MSRSTRTATALAGAVAAIAVGYAARGAPDPAPAKLPAIATVGSGAEATLARPAYPDSIAVLGHSGATGEDSDPSRPHVEVRENSWATGTNPAVNSVYQRILARNPRILGHAVNLAQAGASVHRFVEQARRAVALKPAPELVLVQVMDNDIQCPATRADYAAFGATFRSGLRVLARGAPASRFFVVSQFGSPDTYARALTPAQRRAFGGTGPCAFLDPRGRIVPKEVDRLERIIQGYQRELRRQCARVPRCRYDGGAFDRVVDRQAYITEDLNHFTVKGHARAAAVAWAALRRLGLIP